MGCARRVRRPALARARTGFRTGSMAAVAAALLLNLIASTEFGLAQNDALLLIVALLAHRPAAKASGSRAQACCSGSLRSNLS